MSQVGDLPAVCKTCCSVAEKQGTLDAAMGSIADKITGLRLKDHRTTRLADMFEGLRLNGHRTTPIEVKLPLDSQA